MKQTGEFEMLLGNKQLTRMTTALTLLLAFQANSQEKIVLNEVVETPFLQDGSLNKGKETANLYDLPVLDADNLAEIFEQKAIKDAGITQFGDSNGLAAQNSNKSPLENWLSLDQIPSLNKGEQAALSEFYKLRNYEPYFTSDQAASDAIHTAIAEVETHGLPATRYEIKDANDDEALKELQLAAQFLRYANDMEVGIVSPSQMGPEFDLYPQGRSYAEFLSGFTNAKDKAGFLKSLEPNDPAYQALRKELARLKSLGAQKHNAIIVPDGPTLRLGDRDARVGLMRGRLEQLGFKTTKPVIEGGAEVADAEAVAQAIADEISGKVAQTASTETTVLFDPSLYDEALFEAVKAYQEAAGLTVDGVVGPATITVMNSGPQDHVRSVLVGLERHRWGDQDRSGRRIFVNIANFMTEVRDDNEKVFETVVVVGKNLEDWRTPEFNDSMTHLVVNPKWNVPESISVREYLPKMKRDPGILERNNIVMRVKGSGQVVNPSRIDMSQFSEDDFPFLLQQQSGDGNALGKVKFMFPNKHNIYLHDTPSKSLFSQPVRAYSHGCVRVRDPEDFATLLLSRQYKDARASYREILASKKERHLELASPVPIYLTYHTAYLNNTGTISYAPDSYGRDRQLEQLLKAEGVVF